MAALGKLVVDLSANIAEFTNAMDKAAYTAKNRMDRIAGMAKVAGGALVGMVSVDFLRTQLLQAAEFADAIGDLAVRAGVTTEAMSALAYAARIEGIADNEIAKALRALGNEAQTGGEKIKLLGISMLDASGDAKTSDALFAEVADRIAGIEDPALKAATAAELFGEKIGPQLLPLLNAGSAGLRQATAEAKAFGLVVSEEAAAKAGEFNDNLSKLSQATQGLAADLAGPLISALANVTSEFVRARVEGESFFGALERSLFDSANIGKRTTLQQAAADIEQLDAELRGLQERAQRGLIPEGSSEEVRLNTVSATLAEARKNYAQLAEAAQAAANTTVEAFKPPAELFKKTGISAEEAAKKIDTYIDGLRRQIEATQDLTVYEQVLRDMQMGRITGVSEAQRNQILGYAQELDMLRMLDAELDQATQRETQLRQEADRRSKALADAGKRVYEETRTPLENLNIRMAELNSLLQQGTIDWDTYSRAVFQAQDRYDELSKTAEESTNQMTQLVEGWANRSADAFADFAMTGKLNFRGLVNSMIADLVRLAAKQAILSAVTSFFPGFKFAEGGIMTGGGPMALKSYATGGIANSPQLALFGEGSTPEAFVPLPDGRTIPVTLNGGSGGGTSNVVVNVNVESGSMQTSSQGDASQLGKVIAVAVRSELINQKRPGGLLAA